jgi:hypothetical protein
VGGLVVVVVGLVGRLMSGLVGGLMGRLVSGLGYGSIGG